MNTTTRSLNGCACWAVQAWRFAASLFGPLAAVLLCTASVPRCEASPLRDLRNDARAFALDSRELFRATLSTPFHRRSALSGAAALTGIALVSLLDEPVHTATQRAAGSRGRDQARRLGSALSPGKISIAATTLYLAGWGTGRSNLRTIGRESMEALLWTGTATSLLKGISGRDRPFEGDGAYDFDPLGGDASWPSGHAGSAFALATVLARHSERRAWRLLAYSVAGLVAAERVVEDVHWTSDVLAGALIGYGVGWTITERTRGAGSASRNLELRSTRHGLALGFRF